MRVREGCVSRDLAEGEGRLVLLGAGAIVGRCGIIRFLRAGEETCHRRCINVGGRGGAILVITCSAASRGLSGGTCVGRVNFRSYMFSPDFVRLYSSFMAIVEGGEVRILICGRRGAVALRRTVCLNGVGRSST